MSNIIRLALTLLLWRDLRDACRRLRREPGLAAVAIATIAIAIGACTAMASVVQAVLLAPLGVDRPDRVVIIWPTQNGTAVEFPYRATRDLERMQALEAVALISSTTWGGSLTVAGGEPVALVAAVVSGSFFDVVRTRPLLGRTLRRGDDDPDAARVAVISHGLWTRHFGADPGVIGRTVRIREEVAVQSFEIVGVMPPEMLLPVGTDYWTTAAPRLAGIARAAGDPIEPLFDGLGVFHAVGRLRSGTSLSAARSETPSLVKSIADELTIDLSPMGIVLTPLADQLFGRARPALRVLTAAVFVLLMIACTNVAALLHARGTRRGRELAIRASLGADRRALARQLFVESSLLAVCGAAAGIAIAAVAMEALLGLSPAVIPRLAEATVDGRVLAFALGMTIVTTVALGVAPAWLLSRPSLVDALKGSAAGATGYSGSRRTGQVLVAAQVAGTLVLLIATGLSVRSFARLAALDLGFDPTGVLTFSIKNLDNHRHDAIEALLARFARLPQVAAAGALSQRPFENGQVGWDTHVILEGQVDRPESWGRNPTLNWETVGGDYFRAMGIRLVRGRVFDAADSAEAPAVVIVSEAAANRLWPGQDPLGKRLRESYLNEASKNAPPPWQTVVGVVATARYREIDQPRLDLYVPLRQGGAIQHFTIRTAIDPLALAPTLAAEITAFEPDLAMDRVTTMAEVVRRTRGPWQFTMQVFSLFGAVALGLAVLGVISLVTYAVHQRTREIGVRMALGAARGDVVGLMLLQGMRPAVVGLAVGLLAAVLTTRVLSSLLFEVSPTDPATFGAIVVMFAAAAALASYLPARRAASVDPLVVLRDQ